MFRLAQLEQASGDGDVEAKAGGWTVEPVSSRWEYGAGLSNVEYAPLAEITGDL